LLLGVYPILDHVIPDMVFNFRLQNYFFANYNGNTIYTVLGI